MKEKKLSLAMKILIAMVLGLVFGFALKSFYGTWTVVTGTVGSIFLRMLKMTILPLIICSIVGGIASMASLKELRQVGIRFIIYWGIASFLATVSGLVWSYVIQPGVGVQLAESAEAYSTEGVSLLDTLIGYFPDNVFNSLANFNIINVIIFCLFVGIAIAAMPEGKYKSMLSNAFAAGNDLMTRIVEMVMKTAPFGVFCLMAETAGSLGLDVLGAMSKMLLTQYVAYATLIVVVFPLILVFIAKVNPIQHFKNVFPAMVLAASTCSSAATLPLTMKCAKERCGIPSDTVGLIAPPAATINMQACCAEMAIYAVFAAQLFGRSYSIGELALIIVLGAIMAAGVAGVPGGGIMMCAIMMETMGLPLTIVPWVAGIYTLIDMPNTMLNVTGDTVGMVTVSSMIGNLDKKIFNAKNKSVSKD